MYLKPEQIIGMLDFERFRSFAKLMATIEEAVASGRDPEDILITYGEELASWQPYLSELCDVVTAFGEAGDHYRKIRLAENGELLPGTFQSLMNTVSPC